MKRYLLAAAIAAALSTVVALPVVSQGVVQGNRGAQAAPSAQRGAMASVERRGRGPTGHAPDAFREWIADFLARQIVRQMTLAEKLDYIGGTGAWDIKPLARLGLPQIYASDASLGVRLSSPSGVAYPAGQSLASTFDTRLAWRFGSSLGRDTRQLGFQNILGPGVNMYRTPYAGRAFEYMSGEDPYLGAAMAPQVIDGIQQQGVWATLKHLVANDQEENRFKLNAQVDERTLRELYLVPFESAVKVGRPANIMCAFNRLNGDYACENRHVETDIVKSQWGYRGFIESDYNAIMDGPKAALSGTDIDMPSGYLMNAANLQPLIDNGTIPVSVIDDKVLRIVRQIVLFGFNNGTPSTENTQTADQRQRSKDVALQVSRQGTVLLKNANATLPLSSTSPLRIAVIGQRATGKPPSGGGSAFIDPGEYVTDIDGIRTNAPAGSTVDFLDRLSLDPALTPSEAGFIGDYTHNGTTLTRTDALVNLDWNQGASPFGSDFPDSAMWTGQIRATQTGDHVFKVRADGAVRLFVNGQEIINNGDGTPITPSIPPTLPATGVLSLTAGQVYDVVIQYTRKDGYIGSLSGLQGVQFSWASLVPPTGIADYDAVVIVAGLGSEYEGEGYDRPFVMPESQDELISNVAAANPHTTVVVHAGGGVSMRAWVDQAAAVLYPWYPGEMGGQALGEILFGKVNPSAKLPITIERKESDNPTFATYPLPQNSLDSTNIVYSEGLLNGYRGFEAMGITPEFAFGHGLSYTTFRYSGLHVTMGNIPYLDGQVVARARFRVTNTGDRDGAEVAQVYVGQDSPSIQRPGKELKGFARVSLRAGESRDVVVPLNARAFAWYDTSYGEWRVQRGSYTVSVGGASDAVADTDRVVFRREQTLSVRDSLPAIVDLPDR